jgi:DNA-binding PadR family transcriptional regulator
MHLGKLEEAGYVTGATVLVGRRPKTTYRLTAAGRSALAGYLAAMRRLLDAVEASRGGRA